MYKKISYITLILCFSIQAAYAAKTSKQVLADSLESTERKQSDATYNTSKNEKRISFFDKEFDKAEERKKSWLKRTWWKIKNFRKNPIIIKETEIPDENDLRLSETFSEIYIHQHDSDTKRF